MKIYIVVDWYTGTNKDILKAFTDKNEAKEYAKSEVYGNPDMKVYEDIYEDIKWYLSDHDYHIGIQEVDLV